jgi:hypothetical protein
MSAADIPSPMSPSDRPKVRFRDRGPPVIHSQARPGCSRPPSSEQQQQQHSSSAPNAAAAQQGWGVLFDEGYSTPRLGHVLRGLAALVVRRTCPCSPSGVLSHLLCACVCLGLT